MLHIRFSRTLGLVGSVESLAQAVMMVVVAMTKMMIMLMLMTTRMTMMVTNDN